jgi:hypothetical protein
VSGWMERADAFICCRLRPQNTRNIRKLRLVRANPCEAKGGRFVPEKAR